MACYFAHSFSLQRDSPFTHLKKWPPRPRNLMLSSAAHGGAPSNFLVFEAARLLGPPARFEASKLTVDFQGDNLYDDSRITPRTYALSHCDRTANLTLTVSSLIDLDQLKGWYNKDDVVAEWKKAMGETSLHVHCHVGGPNLLMEAAAEFRYHIFCKELPLVLKAILRGDSVLFRKHPELMDALVRVYFHSSSHNYNCVECWGSLKDAAELNFRTLGSQRKQGKALPNGREKDSSQLLQTGE